MIKYVLTPMKFNIFLYYSSVFMKDYVITYKYRTKDLIPSTNTTDINIMD